MRIFYKIRVKLTSISVTLSLSFLTTNAIVKLMAASVIKTEKQINIRCTINIRIIIGRVVVGSVRHSNKIGAQYYFFFLQFFSKLEQIFQNSLTFPQKFPIIFPKFSQNCPFIFNIFRAFIFLQNLFHVNSSKSYRNLFQIFFWILLELLWKFFIVSRKFS